MPSSSGLSGLQFREFYAILLPFYASVGVPGAAEHLALLDEDDTKRAARGPAFPAIPQ